MNNFIVTPYFFYRFNTEIPLFGNVMPGEGLFYNKIDLPIYFLTCLICNMILRLWEYN